MTTTMADVGQTMRAKVQRETIKHAVARTLNCPACGTCLDYRRATTATATDANGRDRGTAIRCHACARPWIARLREQLPQGWTLEILGEPKGARR